jgi:hypothetical protein
MGGSPYIWSELPRLLSITTPLSLREADKWCAVGKMVGMTAEDGWRLIPTWYANGVVPGTIWRAYAQERNHTGRSEARADTAV